MAKLYIHGGRIYYDNSDELVLLNNSIFKSASPDPDIEERLYLAKNLALHETNSKLFLAGSLILSAQVTEAAAETGTIIPIILAHRRFRS